MESRRGEWAERVAGWRRSGLSAKHYASSIGVNAGTLTHWAWRLGGERQRRRRAVESSRRSIAPTAGELIEVVSSAGGDDRFELRLENGRRVHVPPRFDAAALHRLLEVLEARR